MRLSIPLAALLLLSASAFPALAGWEEGEAAYGRRDWAAALRELQPLAQAGHVEATSRLGHLYLHGWGVPRNPAEAIRLLRLAADRGDALAQNTLGGLLFQGKDMAKDTQRAIALFEQAAAQGQPNALNNLGQLYFVGNALPRDEARAVSLFRRAAERNIPASWEALGLAYWDGRGVERDRAQAVVWFRRAAERDMVVAQNRLGMALWTGDGIGKNQAEAVAWFEKAAARSDASSAFNAALAYQQGMGVAKDLLKSATYYILAARTAKPTEKKDFETKRDDARRNFPADLWAQAEIRANGQALAVPNTVPVSKPQQFTGSGLVINRSGAVLTNAHVVENCKSIYVSVEGQNPQTARLADRDRDKDNDLAVLQTPLVNVEPLKFREDKPMRSGDSVVAVGYPLSTLLSREPNVTAGVISALAGMQGDKRFYQVTAPIQKGNSGGPLVDMTGNVVGIVSSKLNAMKIANSTGDLPQNVNFAIRTDIARKFLTDNGHGFGTAPSPYSLSAADVGELVKKATVFIECQR